MAILTKTPVVILHGGVDQKTDPQLLPKEKLVEALNVHQPQPGILSKRNGYERLPLLSDVAEDTQNEEDEYILSEGRDLASNGEALVARTNKGVYVRTNAVETDHWERKAADHLVQVKPLSNTVQFGYRPTSIRTPTGLTYYFCGDAGDWDTPQPNRLDVGAGNILSNRPSWWYYKVLDADGVEIVPLSKMPPAFSGWMVLPILDSTGKVWVFAPLMSAGPSATVLAVVFDPAGVHPEFPTTPTDPAQTVYYLGSGVGDRIWGLDVFNNAAGDVVVCIRGENLPATDTNTYNTLLSILDPTTGLPDTGLGVVGSDVGVDPSGQECVSFCKNATDSDYFITISGGIQNTATPLTIARFAASSLLLIDFSILDTGTSTDDYAESTTFRDPDSGNLVTFATSVGDATPTPSLFQWDYRADRFEHDPSDWSLVQSSYDDDLSRLRMSVASQLFVVNGRRYILLGQDDNYQFSQGSFLLVDAEDPAMPILGRALYGQSGGFSGRAVPGPDGMNSGNNNGGWLSPVPASNIGARTVDIILPAFNGTDFFGAEVAFVFDDPPVPEGQYGRLGPLAVTANGEEIAVPSAWPLHVVGTEAVEAAPPIAPPFAPSAEAAGNTIDMITLDELDPGDYAVYYSYVWVSPKDGSVIESDASPISDTVTIADDQTLKVTVENLATINSRDSLAWGIRIYVTAVDDQTGPPFLQTTLRNDAYSPTQEHVFNQNSIRLGQILYTFGDGALANTPPEAYGVAAAWGSRLLLSDTAELGTVWVSKERNSIGLGYEFAVDLTFNISQTARIHALGPVSEQYFAFFSADSIWAISSSQAPDNLGNGMYQPFKVESGDLGCINPHSVLPGPDGLRFQATDGRMKLLTPQLQVIDINAGVESKKGAQIEACVYDPLTQKAEFFYGDDPDPPSMIPVGLGNSFFGFTQGTSETGAGGNERYLFDWSEIPGDTLRIGCAGSINTYEPITVRVYIGGTSTSLSGDLALEFVVGESGSPADYAWDELSVPLPNPGERAYIHVTLQAASVVNVADFQNQVFIVPSGVPKFQGVLLASPSTGQHVVGTDTVEGLWESWPVDFDQIESDTLTFSLTSLALTTGGVSIGEYRVRVGGTYADTVGDEICFYSGGFNNDISGVTVTGIPNPGGVRQVKVTGRSTDTQFIGAHHPSVIIRGE